MKKYLVGGAVRDLLLNLPIKDKDYVVVGSSPEELKALGFIQIAQAFPVFLDPIHKHEYALARVESKIGKGYKGFACTFDKNTSLYQDLYRRDLTINAIALDDEGHLYDPYNGIQDLAARRIKHVSERFADDPLRLLRVARFYARLSPQGFFIDHTTLEAMRAIVTSRELTAISGERIFMEIIKALQTTRPDLFFRTLQDLEVFAQIMLPLAQLNSTVFANVTTAAALTADSAHLLAVLLFSLSLSDIQSVLHFLKAPKIILKMMTVIKKHSFFLATPGGTAPDFYAVLSDGTRIKNSFAFFYESLLILGACYPDQILRDKVLILQQLEVALKQYSPSIGLKPTQIYAQKLALIQKLLG